MSMREDFTLLKSRRGFLRWAERVLNGAVVREWGYYDDSGEYQEHKRKPLVVKVTEPTQYPCFGYLAAVNCYDETDVPGYLYLADVSMMHETLREAVVADGMRSEAQRWARP